MAGAERVLKKLAVLLEDAASPGGIGLGLLDRFLLGYPRSGGGFALRPADRSVAAYTPAPTGAESAEIARRRSDHGLLTPGSPEGALLDADAVLVVPAGGGQRPWEGGWDLAVLHTPTAPVFVHGVLAKDLLSARRTAAGAARNRILLSGSYLPCTWRLPPAEVELDAELVEALIVTVGEPEEAEYLGAEGILSVVERRRGGEAGIASVTAFRGEAVWQAARREVWSAGLIAAAISRSDRPQGDPVKDGRTQDLVGLGLLPSLARDPVAYVIEHRDGLRTSLLVLNGVVGDINFAVRARSGAVTSAQFYRPPNSHHLSRLAELVERFFVTGLRPWPLERGLLLAGLLDALRRSKSETEKPLQTPELDLRYSAAREPLFGEL